MAVGHLRLDVEIHVCTYMEINNNINIQFKIIDYKRETIIFCIFRGSFNILACST